MKNINTINLTLFVLTALMLGFLFSAKIDLTTADLGRHLQNGEVIVSGTTEERNAVLNQNFYSYTSPEHPFVNHHWLSGVVYFLIFKIGGFEALSLLNISLLLGAILFIFLISKDLAGKWLAILSIFAVIPLISSRLEVRPESFTYILFALFLFLLWKLHVRQLSSKYLYLLPLLQLLWVNLHIGFVFGALLMASFTTLHLVLLTLKKENQFKTFFVVSLLSAIATFINPHFVSGALYPLRIFDGYGYRIVENQSILFLQNLNFNNPGFLVWWLLVCFVLLGILISIKKNIRNPDFWLVTSLWTIFTILSFLAIRNFPIFGIFSVFMICFLADRLSKTENDVLNQLIFILLFCLAIFGLWRSASSVPNQTRGLGTYEGTFASVEFFKANDLKGPIFNNYDIGGFLIHSLWPKEKVFTDNRPEAYAPNFFDDTYIPIQEDLSLFKEAEEKYGFKTIFFSHRDHTPWGQEFLVELVKEGDWVPVYVDSFNIIFVKNSGETRELIQKYLIPKSRFGLN